MSKDGRGRTPTVLASVGLPALAVACCAAGPLLLAAFAGVSLAALLGLAGAAFAVIAASAALVLVRRRRRACEPPPGT